MLGIPGGLLRLTFIFILWIAQIFLKLKVYPVALKSIRRCAMEPGRMWLKGFQAGGNSSGMTHDLVVKSLALIRLD
jgi:hypothetical protein